MGGDWNSLRFFNIKILSQENKKRWVERGYRSSSTSVLMIFDLTIDIYAPCYLVLTRCFYLKQISSTQQDLNVLNFISSFLFMLGISVALEFFW
jgi:hypothetical protein